VGAGEQRGGERLAVEQHAALSDVRQEPQLIAGGDARWWSVAARWPTEGLGDAAKRVHRAPPSGLMVV